MCLLAGPLQKSKAPMWPRCSRVLSHPVRKSRCLASLSSAAVQLQDGVACLLEEGA